MIKVLHIGLSPKFGGIESFLLNLNRAIDRKSFSFDYVAYDHGVSRESEFNALGGRIYHLSNRRDPLKYIRDLRSIMTNDYDVIHIHKNSAADFLPFLCARNVPSVKIVAHAHSTHASGGGIINALNVLGRRVVLACSDVRLACSIAAGEWLYGNTLKIDEVIPNGIDVASFTFNPAVRVKIRAELGVGNDPVIGCVGGFRRVKNQAFLAGVIKELHRRNINAYALFLGCGDEMESTKERFVKEGCFDFAIFLGETTDVSAYMQAMDVLAMPSLFEGLPLVAVEAQAAGLPTLLSDRISKEACITQMAQRLPIGEGTESLWADAISTSSRYQLSGSVLSSLSAFDSKNTAKLISEIYKDEAR